MDLILETILIIDRAICKNGATKEEINQFRNIMNKYILKEKILKELN